MTESSGFFQLEKLAPHPALADLVDTYWWMWGQSGSLDESDHAWVVPMGYPMLEFNLGDSWQKQVQGEAQQDSIDSHITCLTASPLTLRPLGTIRTAIVRLHPLALYRFLGTDMRTNQLIELEQVFGRDLHETLDRLSTCKRPEQVKDVLDQFFIKSFEKSKQPRDARTEYLLNQIIASKGQLALGQAIQSMGISQKRMEQLFQYQLGMPPKAYAGLARFQFALACYPKCRNLTELAHRAGYYDQAHFIRHFKRYVGLTPLQFFKEFFSESHLISNLYNFSN